MPCRGLTQDGHGKEFSLGGEAVLCVVIHEPMFVPTGGHCDMALQTHAHVDQCLRSTVRSLSLSEWF